MFQYDQFRFAFVCLSGLLIMLHLGCTRTSNVVIDDIGEIPEPLIEQFPLTVGIYYSDEFRAFKTVITESNPDFTIIFHIDLGRANVAIFNYMLPRTFKSITPLNNYPDSKGNHEGIDLIIVPEIFNYHYATSGIVMIEYEIRFYLPNGGQITSWRIRATSVAQEGRYYGIGHQKRCGEITKEAFRDFAAIFFSGFCEQTKFKEIFQNLCAP